MTQGVRWSQFASEAPGLAAAGQELLYNYGLGLGFLATVAPDGGPRVHPVCPVIANDGLYVFMGNQSPKRRDLHERPRFALHSFPLPDIDDEFLVRGVARVSEEPEVREVVYAAYVATCAHTSDDTLFELLLESAMHAKYGPRPSWPPDYTIWRAPTR